MRIAGWSFGKSEARLAVLPAIAVAGCAIEIACTFARRDGSHLTDRRRIIPDTVNMKSRKHYAGMLVGLVNVNANKAKCSVVTASRI